MCRPLSQGTVKRSRKTHCCEWCGKRIAIGDPAFWWSGIDGSQMYKGYMHLECYEAESRCQATQSVWVDQCELPFIPYEQMRGKTVRETEAIQGLGRF